MIHHSNKTTLVIRTIFCHGSLAHIQLVETMYSFLQVDAQELLPPKPQP